MTGFEGSVKNSRPWPGEPIGWKRIQSWFLSIREFLSHSTSGVFQGGVRRIVQTTLIVFVAIAGLVGLGLLAINLYVQSPDTQLRLREIVSENLGYPVSVFRISFTPWSGFHLEDVSIQDPSVDYPIMKAQDLWIQCNYMPLFRRKLIVRQVILSGAEFRIPTAARPGSNEEAEEAPVGPADPSGGFRQRTSHQNGPGHWGWLDPEKARPRRMASQEIFGWRFGSLKFVTSRFIF